MKPENLYTKIFLDGGDPKETREAIELLGFLDGQTTNPTLVSRHPMFKKCMEESGNCTNDEAFEMYREIVKEISPLVPDGSVSIEVYADFKTKAEEMIEQAYKLNTWVPNAHIKLPTTTEGLKAAEHLIGEGMRVNMTLVFTQEQAAAVYSATKGAKKGDVFLSPFVGRLDDIGEDGMSLITNIQKMYKDGDGHVEILVASVRNMNHFLATIRMRADIITSPLKFIKEWAENGMDTATDYQYDTKGLKEIAYKDLNLEDNWKDFDINNPLTTKGLKKFAEDWNALLN